MNVEKLRNNEEVIDIKTNKRRDKKRDIEYYVVRLKYKFWHQNTSGKVEYPKDDM